MHLGLGELVKELKDCHLVILLEFEEDKEGLVLKIPIARVH